MQFFFHVVGNGSDFRDQDGEAFASARDAENHATRIAHELRHDGYQGCAVSVTNSAGDEMARVPIGGVNG